MCFVLEFLSPASPTPSPAVSCAITPPVFSAFDGASRWKPNGMLRAHYSKHALSDRSERRADLTRHRRGRRGAEMQNSLPNRKWGAEKKNTWAGWKIQNSNTIRKKKKAHFLLNLNSVMIIVIMDMCSVSFWWKSAGRAPWQTYCALAEGKKKEKTLRQALRQLFRNQRMHLLKKNKHMRKRCESATRFLNVRKLAA